MAKPFDTTKVLVLPERDVCTMRLHDLGDIAGYLLEVEASLSRMIDRQQRPDGLREIRELLHYLREVAQCLRKPENHQQLDTNIQKIRFCDEHIKTLIETKHNMNHSKHGVKGIDDSEVTDIPERMKVG